jgi:hypothetical protein
LITDNPVRTVPGGHDDIAISSTQLCISGDLDLPFFAFVGFGVSKEGAVYERHRMWERDEDAIACIGLDIVLKADMVLYSDSYSLLDH